MAEVINTNAVFDSTKKFVDFEGLDYFWGQAKKHIDDADKALSDRLGDAEGDISDLKGKVGDANSGLVQAVASLRNDVDALGGAEGGIQSMIDSSIEALDLANTYDAKDSAKNALEEAKSYADGKASANTTAINGLADRVATLEGIDKAADVVYGTDKYIYLVDANGDKIGSGFDASDFVVDGMLDSVDFEKVEVENEDGSKTEVKTNNLVFTFNTASGKEEVKVDFTKYVDTYHADNSSISLDSTTNTFSLKSADADLVQVDSIPVGGTPLADVLLAAGVSEISAGNLQQVFEALFSQNVWAEDATRNIPSSLTVSMGNPTITFSKTGTQEVGTSLNVTASAATASASATLSYSGFDYGWADANDNTKDADGNPASSTITGSAKTTTSKVDGEDVTVTSNYKLSFVTNNGFGSVDIADVDDSSLSATAMTVAEGTNKITVTATSPVFVGNVPAQSKYYACSSLGKTSEDHIVDALAAGSTIEGAAISKTNNTSITGAYKFYVGVSSCPVSASADIKKLSKTAWSNGANDVNLISSKTDYAANNYVVVAVPSAYKIKDAVNSFGLDGMIFGTASEVDYELPSGTTIKYNVYNAFIGEPYGFNKITIGK